MTILRWAAAAFLAWHGMVHVVMWRFYDSTSWDPRHSWLFGDVSALAFALAVVVAALFAGAGVALLTRREWWGALAIAASVASIALMALTFDTHWLWGIGIDAAVIAASALAMA